MSERIDQFCEDLRLKLNKIDEGLSEVKSKITADSAHAEQDVRSHADRVQQRIAQNRDTVASARVEMKSWLEERKDATREKIAEWKARRETNKLEDRAAEAEGYAEAAIAIAAAALDDAEHAAIEAWLARNDVNAAKAKQAPHAH